MGERDEICDKIRRVVTEYDWGKLPYRVSTTICGDMGKLCWNNGDNIYLADGEDMSVVPTTIVTDELPYPIIRGNRKFYLVTKKFKIGYDHIRPHMLDVAYIEFFIDMFCGTLGIERTRSECRIWRRYGARVEQITSIEDLYGVKKPVEGILEICMDIIETFPELAPMTVVAGVALVGSKQLLTPVGREPLPDDIIPKLAVDDSKADVDMLKARALFELLVPDPESRHNLLLGTVYPYFRDSSEKFFILRGIGGNGKSTYMEHFNVLLGKNFTIIDLIGMSSSGFDRFSSAAMIAGKLVLQTPEAGMDNPKLLEPIKKIASGERFAARAIGGNMFTFKSDSVLFVDTNTDVELGESPAILRRRIGVVFSPVTLSRDDLEDYYNWVGTIDGALSILMLAYEYLVYECEGKFFWNNVDINSGNTVEDNIMETLVMLWEDYQNCGPDVVWAVRDIYLGASRQAKERWEKTISLQKRNKRIDGGKLRWCYTIDDEKIFRKAMEALMPTDREE